MFLKSTFLKNSLRKNQFFQCFAKRGLLNLLGVGQNFSARLAELTPNPVHTVWFAIEANKISITNITDFRGQIFQISYLNLIESIRVSKLNLNSANITVGINLNPVLRPNIPIKQQCSQIEIITFYNLRLPTNWYFMSTEYILFIMLLFEFHQHVLTMNGIGPMYSVKYLW